MQKYNFINFIHIVDLSLLNYIDYIEVIEGSYKIQDNKIVINLNSKTKKILVAFILNNINDAFQYGKTNIVVNTCKPMINWRKNKRNKAIKSYKYLIDDQSIYIDTIKLNQFLDNIFKKLPNYNINTIKKDYQNLDNLVDIHKLELTGKIKFIELNEIDNYDGFIIINNLFSNIGSLTFDTLNYNIIKDGNCVYKHDSSIPDELKEELRLQFLQKGLI